ncbi:hypothetical protein ACWD6R_15135 [Streptomyces sp. NPDC005151]
MLLTQVALVSETNQITPAQLNRVAASLQKQATRDFSPLWNVSATVDPFDQLEDVPVGYWPVIVRDDINEPGAAGVHLDEHGQPFALVQYSDSWSLTASHETLEMLADPTGNRLMAGQSPKPDQGVVEFLVEVADPPEDPQFGYTVNGFLVSDFITPHFYDPVPADGVRYSFGGNIKEPRSIREGGYISWLDRTTNEWWQQVWFGTSKAEFRLLGRMTHRTSSLRSAIDAKTETALRIAQAGPQSLKFADARTLTTQIKKTTASRAQGWRDQIEALMAGKIVEGAWEGGEEQNG